MVDNSRVTEQFLGVNHVERIAQTFVCHYTLEHVAAWLVCVAEKTFKHIAAESGRNLFDCIKDVAGELLCSTHLQMFVPTQLQHNHQPMVSERSVLLGTSRRRKGVGFAKCCYRFFRWSGNILTA